MINNGKCRQRKRQRGERWCNYWFEKERVVFCEHLKKTDSFSASWRPLQSPEQSWRNPWSWTAFWYGLHPHFEYRSETEKMVKKIVVVHSKKSALEDTVKLCHYPVVIMTLQSKPLEVFENRLDVYSSLLVSFLLCSTQCLFCFVLHKLKTAQLPTWQPRQTAVAVIQPWEDQYNSDWNVCSPSQEWS